MVDAHVHLEKGSYCREWIDQFVSYALSRGIDEIWFLEHTHIFRECQSLYREMADFNAYQRGWYAGKLANARPLSEYTDFIDQCRRETFPVRIRFGLEVCYSPEHEREIEIIRDSYPFDFLVGSVHFIDGWAFSHKKQPWKPEDCDLRALYKRYYALLEALANSHLFSGLAHPNSLQCFGAYPPGDYGAQYDTIARALKESGMYVEESSGLFINYGDMELGMNKAMLSAMLSHQVPVVTASDTHVPQDTGKFVGEMEGKINENRRNLRQNRPHTGGLSVH